MKDFFIRCDGKYIRVDPNEIRYIESLKNYVRIVTTTGSHLALVSLRQVEEELPASQFCRVHRSYIVSLRHIRCFDQDTVYIEDKEIPISAVYRKPLQGRVNVLVSDTRSAKLYSH